MKYFVKDNFLKKMVKKLILLIYINIYQIDIEQLIQNQNKLSQIIVMCLFSEYNIENS